MCFRKIIISLSQRPSSIKRNKLDGLAENEIILRKHIQLKVRREALFSDNSVGIELLENVEGTDF